MYFLFRKGWPRRFGLAMLSVVGLLAERIGDIYIVAPSVTIALVPLFMCLAERQAGRPALKILAACSGVLLGTANILRSHSGTSVALFMVVIVLFHLQLDLKKKLALILLGTTAMATPFLYMKTLLDRRDAFLKDQNPATIEVGRWHPFWHSVYIGFGFLENNYGIRYNDRVAAEKVRSITPEARYLSKEYEQILRKEVLRLVWAHPFFTIRTLAAKMGVMWLYLIVFANLGLWAAFHRPKPRPVEGAFWVALGFGSLVGLLTVPHPQYVLGFIAFAALYGAVSLNEAMVLWGGDRPIGPGTGS